jgi:hypothetical protein
VLSPRPANFEASSCPNMVGGAFVKKVTMNKDDFEWVTQGAPSGGTAYNTWKRLARPDHFVVAWNIALIP